MHSFALYLGIEASDAGLLPFTQTGRLTCNEPITCPLQFEILTLYG